MIIIATSLLVLSPQLSAEQETIISFIVITVIIILIIMIIMINIIIIMIMTRQG